MRYARLLSWTLFVLFFLVYLTAIKLVRGNHWPSQQHFIHQVAPLYTFQYPYQTNLQQVQAQPAVPSTQYLAQDQPIFDSTTKEARELSQHVTFASTNSVATPDQTPQTITRRHQLPASHLSSNNVYRHHQSKDQSPVGASSGEHLVPSQAIFPKVNLN